MPREAFKDFKFRKSTLATIAQANQIVEEYQAQGFTLTLRQLYYQFVARALLENKQTEYKKLGSIVNDARIAGLMDWDAIEDRTRNLRRHSSWSTPADIIASAADSYKQDPWRDQLYRPEVWIEKDALIGVIEPACNEYRVPYFACRGYSSQSEQYRAGKRFEHYEAAGKVPVVLHLGDHDPSGVDMTRDNQDRLTMFSIGSVEVRRLALNMDQVRRYNPPPNPAKDTDSRSGDYKQQFGNSSWELDALEPQVIHRLIVDELESMIDDTKWKASFRSEEKNRAMLADASDRWESVAEFLKG